MPVIGTNFATTKKEAAGGNHESDVQFAKVGNNYFNKWNIERCLVIDDEISVSTGLGREYSFLSPFSGDEIFMMSSVARKMNETCHDVVCIDTSSKTGEGSFYEEDESNLLYRKWLESRAALHISDEECHSEHLHMDTPLHKKLLRKVTRK